MQKIILDTNVIVSALISDGIPSKILKELVLTKSVQVCLSNEVFEEYIEVLGRDKFLRFPHFRTNSNIVLTSFKDIALLFDTKTEVTLITDESDNKFLELAIESQADYLITGNTNDFNFESFEETKILTPREYWEEYNK